MTRRLYYSDSLLQTFEAGVVACEPAGDQFRVTLDASAFYPTSGGQPHDLGTLEPTAAGGARATVIDVIDDEASGEVWHVVDIPLAVGAVVRGEINPARRLDHMQQHTGQHILSAAFDRLMQARTVSFHMGAESSTIDLSREVTADELHTVEAAANEIVWRDLEVGVRYVSEADAAALPLRKESARTGTLRLVEVPGFDLSACGGTHVPRTGMIGMIAVTSTERFKGGSRVSFACGGRALAAFGAMRRVTQAAARTLTIAAGDVPDAIVRLQTQIKDQQRSIKRLQEQVTVTLAEELRQAAEPGIGGARVVIREQSGWDAAAIKFLASSVVSNPGFVVVLTGEGTPVPVVVARSADVGVDAGAWMKDATAELGGRGGGRPDMAQGGITAGMSDILARASRTLK
jgi:alanyl-tRNA synthetase